MGMAAQKGNKKKDLKTFAQHPEYFIFCISSHWISNKTMQRKGIMFTFFGENTPTVPPSSLTATPISANTASLITK